MKILITGSKGFIGSHLCDHFLGSDHEIVEYDPSATVPDDLDVIFHLAAQTSVQESLKNPVDDANSNILLTLKVLEYARAHPNCHLIYTNTLASEASPYGLSKRTAGKYVGLYTEYFNIKSAIISLANVYGPRCHGLVANIFDAISDDTALTVNNNGESERWYIYVGDVVEHLAWVMDRGFTGRRTLISNERLFSASKVISFASQVAGSPILMRYAEVFEDSTQFQSGPIEPVCLKTPLVEGLRITWNDWPTE